MGGELGGIVRPFGIQKGPFSTKRYTYVMPGMIPQNAL